MSASENKDLLWNILRCSRKAQASSRNHIIQNSLQRGGELVGIVQEQLLPGAGHGHVDQGLFCGEVFGGVGGQGWVAM